MFGLSYQVKLGIILRIQNCFLPYLFLSFLASFSCSGWKCSKCDLRENLWLNLTDGSVLCGKWFFDGSGGNGHAVEHYKETGYPLAVKLGTITPDGAGQPLGRFWDGESCLHETNRINLLPTGFVPPVQVFVKLIWKGKPCEFVNFDEFDENDTLHLERALAFFLICSSLPVSRLI